MKKILLVSLFTLWLIGSLAIRTVGLDRSPASLNYDEAALSYNAYSIMETGRDEYGTFLPLSLRSFNDFKPAVYAYLTIPFYEVFGVNQVAARLPSAVLGTLVLIVIFLFIHKLFLQSVYRSLGIAVFLSLLPWHIHFSRVAFETNIAMAFFTAAAWCLWNFRTNKFYQIGAFFFAALAMYSYHSARLAIPLLFCFYFCDPFEMSPFARLKNPKKLLASLIPIGILTLILLPLFVADSANSLLQRYQQTNIFSHFSPFTPHDIIIGPNAWLMVLGNPVYYLIGRIMSHIAMYVSPRNLSLLLYHWVVQSPQGISGSGMVGWLGGFMFLLGLPLWLTTIVSSKRYRFLAFWFVAAIAPAIITWEGYYPLRALAAFPVIDLIIAAGCIFLLDKVRIIKLGIIRLGVLGACCVIVGLTSLYTILNEWNYAIWDTNGQFQPGGFKEGGPLLGSLREKYQVIYLDSPQAQSYVMLLFYMHYPPQKFQEYTNNRLAVGEVGGDKFSFDNFVHKRYNWVEDKDKHNFMYWTSSEVKEDEIAQVPGAKLYKVYNQFGWWSASIITKD